MFTHACVPENHLCYYNFSLWLQAVTATVEAQGSKYEILCTIFSNIVLYFHEIILPFLSCFSFLLKLGTNEMKETDRKVGAPQIRQNV